MPDLLNFLIYLAVIAGAEFALWLGNIYWNALREVRAERRLEGR